MIFKNLWSEVNIKGNEETNFELLLNKIVEVKLQVLNVFFFTEKAKRIRNGEKVSLTLLKLEQIYTIKRGQKTE